MVGAFLTNDTMMDADGWLILFHRYSPHGTLFGTFAATDTFFVVDFHSQRLRQKAAQIMEETAGSTYGTKEIAKAPAASGKQSQDDEP